MNKKLVLTGKAVLSTVMASTMACSMLSTNILAQEPEVVPEEETTVEKTPVEEEPTETPEEATEVVEEPTETPEEATGGNEETTPSNTIMTNEIVDTPTTYSFPSGYDDSWTEQQLRDEIQRLLDEAASLYEENKYRPMTENDYITKKATAEAALADTTLPKDKLAWQAYYMSNCIKAMNRAQNVLSESAKQIVIINKEFDKLNKSEYQLGAWEALSSALSSARSRINGDASKDYSTELANIESLYEEMLKTKVDENLVILRDYVAECDEMVAKQKTDEAVIYDATGWRTFINALNEAKAEIEKGNTTIDEAVFNKLYYNLVIIRNGLVPLDPSIEGNEIAVTDLWTDLGNRKNIKGGQIFVTGEKINGDGTTTLYIDWVNNGINPLTGEYVGKFENKDFNSEGLEDGVFITTLINEFEGFNKFHSYAYYNNWVDEHGDPINEEAVLNGFSGYQITVPTGSQVIVGLGNKAGQYFGTFAAGVYQTKTPDTTAPEVKVSYSTVDKTEGPVTVTITADEPIQDIPGWTRVSENVLKKDYTANTNESIDVLDLAGNVTTVSVTVSNIVKPSDPSGTGGDKNQGTETKKEESKKTDGTNTGVFVGTGLFAGSATAAAAGASLLAFLKKRKK